MNTKRRFTVDDLAYLPENGSRYEVIDGDLHVTTAPHGKHQFALLELTWALRRWNDQTGLGWTLIGAGIGFAAADAVIPNLV